MRFSFLTFLILVSLSCSCFSPPLPPERLPGEEYDTAPSFPTEKDYPKEIIISGEYTFINNDRSFQFESEKRDVFCYRITTHDDTTSEEIIPLRFRLYNKEGKLLSESLPLGGWRSIREFNEEIAIYPEKDLKVVARISSVISYHKDGVKIKVVLVNDEGKDLRVLAERRALSIEEIRKRLFHEGCYMSEGFVIL